MRRDLNQTLRLTGCPLGDVNTACQVIDASMLAKMGSLLELDPDEPKRLKS
jgi:hypothetical protein